MLGILKAPNLSKLNRLKHHQILGPPRGFGDSGRRSIYFQGFGDTGHLFSGIWGESITFGCFREQGAEEKHFRELGRKGHFSFREQGAKTPPPGRHQIF